jgi:hypothetical protein
MMMVNILTFYMCSFWRWWKLKTMIFLVKYDARFLGDHRGRGRNVQTETPQQCLEDSGPGKHADVHDPLLETNTQAHSHVDKDVHHDNETKRHHHTHDF